MDNLWTGNYCPYLVEPARGGLLRAAEGVVRQSFARDRANIRAPLRERRQAEIRAGEEESSVFWMKKKDKEVRGTRVLSADLEDMLASKTSSERFCDFLRISTRYGLACCFFDQIK